MGCFTIKNVLLYFPGDSVSHINPFLSGKVGHGKPPGSQAMRDEGTEDSSGPSYSQVIFGEIFFLAAPVHISLHR